MVTEASRFTRSVGEEARMRHAWSGRRTPAVPPRCVWLVSWEVRGGSGNIHTLFQRTKYVSVNVEQSVMSSIHLEMRVVLFGEYFLDLIDVT